MKLINVLTRLKDWPAPVLRTHDLMALLNVNKVNASTSLARLERSGHLVRLKRGLWAFPDKADPLALAEHLTHPFPAYISLQSALYFQGMISQITETIFAVSPARTRTYRTRLGVFSIHHVSPAFFFGFAVMPSGCKMAEPEKALLDYLYLSPAKSNLFRALPEFELTEGFRLTTARCMIRQAGRSRRITMLEKRFAEFVSEHWPATGSM